MLDSLEIQNYRNFKHLRIEKLGRVNLIIGKNNTGKTSLLEAVSILVKQNDLDWIYTILENRREHFEDEDMTPQQKFKNLSNLFYGRKPAFEAETGIQLNSKANLVDTSLLFQFVKYKDEELNLEGSPEGFSEILSKMYTQRKFLSPSENGKLGLLITNDGTTKLIPISKESVSDVLSEINDIHRQAINVQFVMSSVSNEFWIHQLWEKTQLTDLEDDVVAAIRLLDINIQRLSFRRNDNQDYAIVKLKNIADPVPLRSMGDGINRILTIVLSMVNCKDGYLLIDEFDNGLHVSVQKQLWEIVFYLANKLNIQVFATTHSHDCIDAFAYVLGSGKYAESDGIMVRLDNWEGNIDATIYESDDIFNTIRAEVDPR